MGLPFEPETMDKIVARFPLALDHDLDIQAHAERLLTKGDVSASAGAERRRVFDFTDGLRIIASRDFYRTENTRRVHLSISANPGSLATEWFQLSRGPKFVFSALAGLLEKLGNGLKEKAFLFAVAGRKGWPILHLVEATEGEQLELDGRVKSGHGREIKLDA